MDQGTNVEVEGGKPPERLPLAHAHQASQALSEALGEEFLGIREDRGELTLWVKPEAWRRANAWMVSHTPFKVMSDYTAVDYLDRSPRFDLSIILLDMEHGENLRLKTMVGEAAIPGDEQTLVQAESLISVWPGSNWFEREIYDLFGITFEGHPNMKRLLLPPDYHGFPLRKDYPVTGPATSMFR